MNDDVQKDAGPAEPPAGETLVMPDASGRSKLPLPPPPQPERPGSIAG